jgi:uncharacterized integral membrane protein
MQKALIVSLVTIILVLVFALQNPGEQTVTFLFWRFTGSMALMALIAIFVGVVLGIALTFPTIQKKNKKINNLTNFIQDFREKERVRVEDEELKDMEKGNGDEEEN